VRISPRYCNCAMRCEMSCWLVAGSPISASWSNPHRHRPRR